MSTTNSSQLSAGVQQLYNAGLLPSSLSNSTLNAASASQLNKMASSTLASQEVSALLGGGGDSASLSSTATNALLQEINPSPTNSTTSTADLLTAAVNNEITSSLNAAVSRFASPGSTQNGSNVNVVG